MTPPRLFSEHDLAQACTDLLALDGWRALKTDPVSRREWGKGFGEAGMADYLYIRYSDQARLMPEKFRGPVDSSYAQVLWIEWKIPAGRVAPKQHAWRERERSRGGLSLIAGVDFHASVEGFCRWYALSGMQRNKFTIGGKHSQNLETTP